LRAQKPERTLEMIKRARGIDYPCHAFGRGAEPSVAKRTSQACTSSAR
jgi:hypothetical protein